MKDKYNGNSKNDDDGRTRLLTLIDQGDAFTILSEDNFNEKFNELIKYELVKVERDKVSLTERGRLALVLGVKSVIQKIKDKVDFSILKKGIIGGELN